jgi:hypothetical protein
MKALRPSVLVDYSIQRSNIAACDYTKGSNHSVSSDKGLTLLTLAAAHTHPHRRESCMHSSSNRLQSLMRQGIQGDRRKSTGMNLPNQQRSILSIRSARTHATSPSNFNRRRAYEHKQLVKALEQALMLPSPEYVISDHDKENAPVVHFHVRKNAGGLAPPGLNRSISNNSALSQLLKESRREKLDELLVNPAFLRQVNRSSLRSSFRSVSAIGVNQQKRLSDTAKRRELASSVATAAAVKAENIAATFHQGMRDFSHPAAQAIKSSLGPAGLKKTSPSSTSNKKKPKLQPPSILRSALTYDTSTKDEVAMSAAKVYNRSSMKDTRLAAASSHSRKSQEHRIPKPQMIADSKQTLMRRAASAPRNSFKASTSVKSGNRSYSKQCMAELEIAALKALAGPSLGRTMGRRSSVSSAGSNIFAVPTTITVIKRTLSNDSCASLTSWASSKQSSVHMEQPGKSANTDNTLQEILVGQTVALPMPSLQRAKSAPYPTLPPTMAPVKWDPPQEPNNPTLADARKGRRLSGLLNMHDRKLLSCRHLGVEDLDSSTGDRSDATDSKVFQRHMPGSMATSSFSSRKSMFLMIQSASLQDSLDLTKLESRNQSPWANTAATRRRRMLQRVESASSRNSASRRATLSASDKDAESRSHASGKGPHQRIDGASGAKAAPIDRTSFMKRETSVTFAETRIRTLRN